MMAFVTVAVFLVVYTLIATERVPRVVAVLGGVAAVFAIGIVGEAQDMLCE